MTTATRTHSELALAVHEFVRKDFSPQFGELTSRFSTNPIWKRFRELGTDLWFDSGNLDEVGKLWTREFSSLTTNNTLLNTEIQTGRYDQLIPEAAELLHEFPGLSPDEQLLEMAFILNAVHALHLVEKFDAYVSVEEHTDLADDLTRSIEYARRYHAICPERFIVKIPFTAAGVLATRQLMREGIAVNHTLGFSARQNYVITRIAQPSYVNVFLGRLSSFVIDNGLGNGDYVGEKATLASQAVVRELRYTRGLPTRQIGASFRTWQQCLNLAGLDVITAPPKVAGQLLEQRIDPSMIEDRTSRRCAPGIDPSVDVKKTRLDTLWDIDDNVVACIEDLEGEDIDAFDADSLTEFFHDHHCRDLFVRWTGEQVARSVEEGKIPKLDHWADVLADGSIGLDSLMNLAGLNSFRADQKKMDDRVRRVLGTGSHEQP
jgi:transaldolase